MKSYADVIRNALVIVAGTEEPIGQCAPRAGHENIMAKNSTGGFTYTVSDEEYIDRILILGTNSNTYYSSASTLTSDAIASVTRMVNDGKGDMIIKHLRDVYESGRAPKQDPTFFILALLTQGTMPVAVRKSALEIVQKLRTFSQLYMWEGMRKQLANGTKGFGRAVRGTLLALIKNRSGLQFAHQATKYRSRKFGNESWSIDDIISCAHIPSRTLSVDAQLVVIYLIKGITSAEEAFKKNTDEKSTAVINYLRAVEAIKSETCTVDTAVQLIRQYHLPREVLSTHLLTSIEVWHAMLFSISVEEGGKIVRRVTMPITALIRNLGVMASREMFADESIAQLVSDHLNNATVLKAGRVHPVTLLVAKLTFDSGKGIKGNLSWTVNKTISNGLESAFYVSFGTVDGTGKRVLHAVDCSGSMTSGMCAVPHITACQAVSTLVMEAVRRETRWFEQKSKHIDQGSITIAPKYVQDVMLFNTTGSFVNINASHTLKTVMNIVQDHNFASTDCAQPMIRALEKFKISGGEDGLYDLFIVYTDNETHYGKIHPSEALELYNKETGLSAKLVVVATTPTKSTIGYRSNECNVLNPSDSRNGNTSSLNIVGFDLNAPALIRNFALGNHDMENNDDSDEIMDE